MTSAAVRWSGVSACQIRARADAPGERHRALRRPELGRRGPDRVLVEVAGGPDRLAERLTRRPHLRSGLP